MLQRPEEPTEFDPAKVEEKQNGTGLSIVLDDIMVRSLCYFPKSVIISLPMKTGLPTIIFYTLLTSLLFLSYSCAKSGRDTDTKTTLTVYDDFDIEPSKGLSGKELYEGSSIGNLIFESLRYDIDLAGFKAENVLMRDITPANDMKKWRIRLRDGIRFHDGAPLTAADMAYSLQELHKSNILTDIKSVRIIDELSIEVETEYTISLTDMSSKNLIAISRASTPKHPIGTGPFRFGRWLDKGVELLSNDRYYKGQPRIDKVVFISEPDERARLSRFLSGDSDLMVGLSPYIADFIRKDDRFYLKTLVAPYHVSLFLNNGSPVFSDRRTRQALNLAVNRGHMLEILRGGGVQASGPFTQDRLPAGAGVQAYPYQPKEAVRLLKEAGWKPGMKDGVMEKGGKRFSFTIAFLKGTDDYKKVADLIAKDLFEVGIEARVEPVQTELLRKRIIETGDYDAALWIQASSSGERLGINWQTPSLHGELSENISRYSNNEVDRLIEEAKTSPDREERKKILAGIQRIIHDDAPAVFLYHPVYFSAVNKRFKGGEEFMGDPYSWYRIKDWTLKEQ